jgi:hypothetical protein
MTAAARTATASAGLLLAAAVLGAGVAGPATAAGSGASSSGGAGNGAATPAAGSFTVGSVTFGEPEDVQGNKCKLTVHGTLDFTGDVAGAAVGTTTAIVFATCEEALAASPGTYFDVFRFEGDFTGTVFGEAAEGTLTYAGVTQEGGEIDARIKLRGDAWAVLRTTDAVVLQGGSYEGKAKAPAS